MVKENGNLLTIVGSSGELGSRIYQASQQKDMSQMVGHIRRDSDNYVETIEKTRVLLLALRQEEGINWLDQHQLILRPDQIVVSAMAGCDFKTLGQVNKQAQMARLMTDINLSHITWTDNRSFTKGNRYTVINALATFCSRSEIEYVGSENDERMNMETLLACEPGWLANLYLQRVKSFADRCTGYIDLDELERRWIIMASLALDRGNFSDTVSEVATPGGVTEHGISIVKDRQQAVFDDQLIGALDKIKQKTKKGSAAGTN